MREKCGRPTKSGKPCQKAIYGPAFRACGTHETAEDVAWREGYFAGSAKAREDTGKEREFWIAEGRRQEQAEIKRRDLEMQKLARFKTRTSDGQQIVEVDGYAYRWAGDPLCIGDQVMLPSNWLSELKHGKGPFPGVVTAIGSSYEGDISSILRKVPKAE